MLILAHSLRYLPWQMVPHPPRTLAYLLQI